jgi:S-methylmethionine-dependent homocysteine/selenocysteine methylase
MIKTFTEATNLRAKLVARARVYQEIKDQGMRINCFKREDIDSAVAALLADPETHAECYAEAMRQLDLTGDIP